MLRVRLAFAALIVVGLSASNFVSAADLDPKAIKIQLPKETAAEYIQQIKTGVRGVGYVKLTPSAPWPKKLKTS